MCNKQPQEMKTISDKNQKINCSIRAVVLDRGYEGRFWGVRESIATCLIFTINNKFVPFCLLNEAHCLTYFILFMGVLFQNLIMCKSMHYIE